MYIVHTFCRCATTVDPRSLPESVRKAAVLILDHLTVVMDICPIRRVPASVCSMRETGNQSPFRVGGVIDEKRAPLGQVASFVLTFNLSYISRNLTMPIATVTAARSARLGLRATPEQETVLRRAAVVAHKSLTDFILDAAYQAAEQTLLDQRLFMVSGSQYQALLEMLDRPESDNPGLADLFSRRPVWVNK